MLMNNEWIKSVPPQEQMPFKPITYIYGAWRLELVDVCQRG